jgi:hypothetical protein
MPDERQSAIVRHHVARRPQLLERVPDPGQRMPREVGGRRPKIPLIPRIDDGIAALHDVRDPRAVEGRIGRAPPMTEHHDRRAFRRRLGRFEHVDLVRP